MRPAGLEAAELFWISTVRADGPTSPLVAVWLDGAIHFSTGGTEQKAINLKSNPHVVLITGNRWDGGLDVVVEGDAVRSPTTKCSSSPRLGPRSGTGGGSTRCTAAHFATGAAQPSCSR
jgi:hypothetical protein